ncbi:MAG: SprT family zinc-dependent metalloprotease [Candidatus Moraniibacteriota bacterium]
MASFPYTLVRSKRKSVALFVARDATLTVRAPLWTSVGCIESFVERNVDWIRRTLERMQAHLCVSLHQYGEGERFWYLGEQYPLRISATGKYSLNFSNGEFFLAERFRSRAKDRLLAWYRREAKKVLLERVAFFVQKHGLVYRSVRINTARTRWGSCSGKGNLNFTFRLVMAPISVIDYVVAHELAHLAHPNHSRKFWQAVAVMCPNFERERRWLKENGHLLEC